MLGILGLEAIFVKLNEIMIIEIYLLLLIEKHILLVIEILMSGKVWKKLDI